MLQDFVVLRFEASRRFRIPLFKDSKHCCRPIASAAGGTVSAAAAAPTAPAPDATMIDRGPADRVDLRRRRDDLGRRYGFTAPVRTGR